MVSITPDQIRELAARLFALATEIDDVDADRSGATEPALRQTGYRLAEAAGLCRRAAEELLADATELGTALSWLASTATCRAEWGVCPEHGNTLTGSGGRSWCRTPGCGRRWGYDRVGQPCQEPAHWLLRDSAGGESQLCDGHALDARERLVDAVLIPLHGQ